MTGQVQTVQYSSVIFSSEPATALSALHGIPYGIASRMFHIGILTLFVEKRCHPPTLTLCSVVFLTLSPSRPLCRVPLVLCLVHSSCLITLVRTTCLYLSIQPTRRWRCVSLHLPLTPLPPHYHYLRRYPSTLIQMIIVAETMD